MLALGAALELDDALYCVTSFCDVAQATKGTMRSKSRPKSKNFFFLLSYAEKKSKIVPSTAFVIYGEGVIKKYFM